MRRSVRRLILIGLFWLGASLGYGFWVRRRSPGA